MLLALVLPPLLATSNANGVGQLPVMGWSGYNAFMQNSGHCDHAGAAGYNETTFLQTMDALLLPSPRAFAAVIRAAALRQTQLDADA